MPQNDRGKVADTFAMPHMLLQLQRSPEREQALRNFMEQQQDSTSPNFHRWLTAVQFGQFYGPSTRDIEAVSGWLRSSGFTVNTRISERHVARFLRYRWASSVDIQNGNSSAFGERAGSHREHERSSNPRRARARDPGIVSLHDFRPQSMKRPPQVSPGV